MRNQTLERCGQPPPRKRAWPRARESRRNADCVAHLPPAMLLPQVCPGHRVSQHIVKKLEHRSAGGEGGLAAARSTTPLQVCAAAALCPGPAVLPAGLG